MASSCAPSDSQRNLNAMRLCQYDTPDSPCIHVGAHLTSGLIVDVARLIDQPLKSMIEFIELANNGDIDLHLLRAKLGKLDEKEALKLGALTLDKLHLRAPVTEPPKFFAIAINGRSNWERSIKPENPRPQYFIKLRTCITGPFDPIELPDIGCVGPEVELALIIGKGGKDIAAADASRHIFGYTVHNDLTAHHLRATSEWIRLRRKDGSEEQLTYPGRWKNFDTFSPMGPFLVTPDEVPDPHALAMDAHLNGELVQQGHSSDVVYRIPELIEYLSAAHTLETGDIVSIGTVPAVEPWKMATIDLRKYGGTIDVSIEGVGRLSNPIRAV
ncbi:MULTISPECIES: fumarylacetoacetate hydrolase family protein [Burkholderia]|uniref:Fumarylacetoacetate hydrolase family protein n=3 Tax=Burkholderia anthina TaxID=179879 RepID=A0ABS2B146_9BURK|nr:MULTISPECIES: fumarylacetoacetate hydrolase family protein [Burkholderia]MBM2766698.1 fumarylacetoacetate hydrolase family protein [Burkholderia anthina]